MTSSCLKSWQRPYKMSPLSSTVKRYVSSQGSPSHQSTGATPSVDHAIDEELLPGAESRLRWFHPTRPGEVLGGRFKTIAKLGFGAGSTVWLAENIKFKRWKKNRLPRLVSVKIAALNTDASGELDRSKTITDAEPTHEGLLYLHTPLDHFKVQGPRGMHSCLVFKPMRETMFRFQQRMPRGRIPLPLFKLYVYCLLQAVDYLHTECDLIHTDIKDDNIMVSIEKASVLADFAREAAKAPHPRHVSSQDGRVTYLSLGDFGDLRGTRLLPELGDFDLSFPGMKGENAHLAPIQSHRYRAPEVLLGCSWSYSVDIWNVGLLMWNLLEDVSLFERPAGPDGEYDAHVHLAQMVSLLGEPPPAVKLRERNLRYHRLEKSFVNPRGKACYTMNEFWGGPFFDDSGRIFRKDLVEQAGRKSLSDTVTDLTGDEKELFLDFASGMLQWQPEKRKTAKELLKHPFFDSLYAD